MEAGEEGEEEGVGAVEGGESMEEAVVERRRRRRRVGFEEARGVAVVAGGEDAEEQRLQQAHPAAERARVQLLRLLHGTWETQGTVLVVSDTMTPAAREDAELTDGGGPEKSAAAPSAAGGERRRVAGGGERSSLEKVQRVGAEKRGPSSRLVLEFFFFSLSKFQKSMKIFTWSPYITWKFISKF